MTQVIEQIKVKEIEQGKEKRNVPELRFRGFEDEWEQYELNDIVNVCKEKYNPLKSTTNLKCIELEHIKQEEGLILGFTNSKEQSSIKNKFNKGDILFGKLRPYLKKYWLAQFEGVCSSEILVLSGKGVLNEFLFRIIQGEKFNNIASVSCGSKMPRADWNYMREIPFNIPSTKEQKKIADFFILIDKKIEKQNEKVEALKTYKKGIMQKIFNQEIRFKDENGGEYPEWENRKIKNIFNVSAGGDISKEHVSNKLTNKFIYPIYSNSLTNDGLYGYSDIYKSDGETITVTGRGVNIGIANARYNKYFPIVRLLVLKPIIQCNVKFFEEAINNTKIFIESTGVPQLTAPQLSNIKVKVPIMEEQIKIANFLNIMDKKIEKEEEKLEELKVWKKGLLQKMFI